MLGTKTSLNKIKKFEIIPKIFSNYGMKLAIRCKKKGEKSQIWKH